MDSIVEHLWLPECSTAQRGKHIDDANVVGLAKVIDYLRDVFNNFIYKIIIIVKHLNLFFRHMNAGGRVDRRWSADINLLKMTQQRFNDSFSAGFEAELIPVLRLDIISAKHENSNVRLLKIQSVLVSLLIFVGEE